MDLTFVSSKWKGIGHVPIVPVWKGIFLAVVTVSGGDVKNMRAAKWFKIKSAVAE